MNFSGRGHVGGVEGGGGGMRCALNRKDTPFGFKWPKEPFNALGFFFFRTAKEALTICDSGVTL